MNILQRILTSNHKKAHPTVEELKTSIQEMEEDLLRLRVELDKNEGNLALPMQEGQPAPVGTERDSQALKDNISELEVQLRVLRSRVMVSSATNTIKNQMAQLSTQGSMTLLENQKENAVAGELTLSDDDKTGASQNANQAPEHSSNACTTQAFIPKADALQEKLGQTPGHTDNTNPAPGQP